MAINFNVVTHGASARKNWKPNVDLESLGELNTVLQGISRQKNILIHSEEKNLAGCRKYTNDLDELKISLIEKIGEQEGGSICNDNYQNAKMTLSGGSLHELSCLRSAYRSIATVKEDSLIKPPPVTTVKFTIHNNDSK